MTDIGPDGDTEERFHLRDQREGNKGTLELSTQDALVVVEAVAVRATPQRRARISSRSGDCL